MSEAADYLLGELHVDSLVSGLLILIVRIRCSPLKPAAHRLRESGIRQLHHYLLYNATSSTTSILYITLFFVFILKNK